jgi:hypothetical protein
VRHLLHISLRDLLITHAITHILSESKFYCLDMKTEGKRVKRFLVNSVALVLPSYLINLFASYL